MELILAIDVWEPSLVKRTPLILHYAINYRGLQICFFAIVVLIDLAAVDDILNLLRIKVLVVLVQGDYLPVPREVRTGIRLRVCHSGVQLAF